MRIIIATDTIEGQVNGVVRTLNSITAELNGLGHSFTVIHTGMFKNFAIPFYKEIRLAYGIKDSTLEAIIKPNEPCCIHILTEGTLGTRVRQFCLKNNLKFTTSFLTKFSEQLSFILPFPRFIAPIADYYLIQCHKNSSCVMVASKSMQNYLFDKGFKSKIAITGKGVDSELFRPYERVKHDKPVCAYIGRVSREKGIEKFLDCKFDCQKVVVGGGPFKDELEAKYPNVKFTGYLTGEALAKAYSDADVFVFPSETDTFGLVLLEAMACGTPVAAFPVTGPIDVITDKRLGSLNVDLDIAIAEALQYGDRDYCAQHALEYTWKQAAKRFCDNLVAN